MKSNWSALSLLNPASRPFVISFEGFQYAFVNGLPLETQHKGYDENVIPESLRIARGGLTKTAKIDFEKAYPPLLLLAGEIDHIIPASLNRTNFASASPTPTDFKEFPGRTRLGIGQSNWQEIADYVLGWLDKQTL